MSPCAGFSAAPWLAPCCAECAQHAGGMPQAGATDTGVSPAMSVSPMLIVAAIFVATLWGPQIMRAIKL